MSAGVQRERVPCGMARSEPDGNGHWRAAEPPCPEPITYAVTIDFDDGHGPVNYGLCPEHTAWVRASLRGVTGVRQAAPQEEDRTPRIVDPPRPRNYHPYA